MMMKKAIGELIGGKPLVHAQASDNVRSAAKHMADSSVGAVAVLKDGKLVGMFTERDLMTRVVARDLDPDKTEVSSVMTRDVLVASSSEKLDDAVSKMKSMNCRHLPVVDEGKLVGMISLRDLLQVDSEMTHAKVDLLSELVTYSPDYES
jgi:signal-transduction protein with cAMP-binding, CBS, and nucleotidyltransferase domain